MQSWIGGCDCHEEQLQAGEEVLCYMKGRRMRSAWDFVQRHLDSGLAHANSMSAARYAGDYNLLRQCQGCVRMVHGLGYEKFLWLDQVPYLLSRLDQPGVEAKTVEQWVSTSPQYHNRVTRKVCDSSGELRADLDAVTGTGDNISPSLSHVMRSLALLPMDDTVCEMPHASGKRIAGSGAASKFPWVASTLRLQQNIADCRELPSKLCTSLEGPWSRYKSVVQPTPKQCVVPPLDNRQFQKRMYSCEHLMGFCGESEFSDEALGDAKEDGCLPEDKAAVEADDVPGEEGAADNPVGRNDQPVLLLRQLIAATLNPHDFVSMPTRDAENPLCVFQLLDFERRNIVMEPFISDDERQRAEGLYTCSIQPLEVWGSTDGGDLVASRELDTFVVSDPGKRDLVAALGATVASWKNIKVWESRESDVEGCLALHSPTFLCDRRLDVLSPTVPVLQLLEQLKLAGFAPKNRHTEHTPDGDLHFDCRRPAGRRCYYQCLLMRAQLWQKGVTQFDSQGIQAYYKALMGCKAAVAKGLKATEYDRMLARERSGPYADSVPLEAPPPLAAPPLPPPARPPSPDGSSIAGDEASDGDLALVEGGDIGGDDVAGGDVFDDFYKPDLILGQHVKTVKGRRTPTHTYMPRLRVVCPVAAHGHCERSRSVALLHDVLGHRCAEAFLGAWLLKADTLSAKQHRDHNPSMADMKRYLEDIA